MCNEFAHVLAGLSRLCRRHQSEPKASNRREMLSHAYPPPILTVCPLIWPSTALESIFEVLYNGAVKLFIQRVCVVPTQLQC
jgi:hypothetical protein